MEESMTEDKFEELGTKADDEKRQCIAIFQDADGNWRGGIKHLRGNEEFFFSRAVGPDTVLQELLTHNGSSTIN